MTELCKLTTQDGRTRVGFGNETQWGENVTHSGTGAGALCGPGYVHAYEHPLVAVLMNPIHADIPNPVLWEGEGEIALRDGQLKCGCVTFMTLRRIPLPELSTEARVEVAIRCALYVYSKPSFVTWAQAWISGADRSERAAWEATGVAERAASAGAARAARAARAAAWTATRPVEAPLWAARAAARAAAANADLPLISILEAVTGGAK